MANCNSRVRLGCNTPVQTAGGGGCAVRGGYSCGESVSSNHTQSLPRDGIEPDRRMLDTIRPDPRVASGHLTEYYLLAIDPKRTYFSQVGDDF